MSGFERLHPLCAFFILTQAPLNKHSTMPRRGRPQTFTDLSCRSEDTGFHIETLEGQSLQVLPTTDRRVTGFGKQWLLSWPYLFISEPFSETGKLWVYRWVHVKCRKYQFGLLKVLQRPAECQWPVLGFAQCFAWQPPFLFITDSTYPNYQGSLFVFLVSRTGTWQQLYHHAPPHECIGHGLTVTKDERDQNSLTAELTGFHRHDGTPVRHTVHLKKGRAHSWEVVPVAVT
jgi:hypothetical protein